MLDPHLLRTNLGVVADQLARRGYHLDIENYAALEEKRKALQIRTEELQNQRNTSSKSIGQAKARGEDIQPLLAEVSRLGDELKDVKSTLDAVREQMQHLALDMPNLPDASVPDGAGEEDNQEARRWGEPTALDFEPRDHVELGEAARGLDFEVAAKLSGSRFAVLGGALARLHRALAQFMLDH
ncbi:MAG: serine--tRNA ligase, partial [Pseudomonadota bacterium]